MNEEEFVIDVSVTVDENKKMIYLYEEDGSGCDFSYGNMQELGEIFKKYIEDALYIRKENCQIEKNQDKICNSSKHFEEEI